MNSISSGRTKKSRLTHKLTGCPTVSGGIRGHWDSFFTVMNLQRIKTIEDCETRPAWCRSELEHKVREGESGQKILRAEIKILGSLLEYKREPPLFEPKLQMVLINKIQPTKNENTDSV